MNGCSVHPGSAKGKMRNAILLAQEFQSLLPAHEAPEATEGYEGFYHPGTIQGNVEHVDVDYIIRDHDREKFEEKKAFFRKAAEFLNAKYGDGTIMVDMKDSYYNMKEKILPENAHLIDNAVKAMEMEEVSLRSSPSAEARTEQDCPSWDFPARTCAREGRTAMGNLSMPASNPWKRR